MNFRYGNLHSDHSGPAPASLAFYGGSVVVVPMKSAAISAGILWYLLSHIKQPSSSSSQLPNIELPKLLLLFGAHSSPNFFPNEFDNFMILNGYFKTMIT